MKISKVKKLVWGLVGLSLFAGCKYAGSKQAELNDADAPYSGMVRYQKDFPLKYAKGWRLPERPQKFASSIRLVATFANLDSSSVHSAQIYDLATTHLRYSVSHEPGNMISNAQFSGDGKWLITSSLQDNTTRLWDATTGAHKFTFTEAGKQAVFYPDSKKVITLNAFKEFGKPMIKVFDAVSGQPSLDLTQKLTSAGIPISIQVSSWGNYLAINYDTVPPQFLQFPSLRLRNDLVHDEVELGGFDSDEGIVLKLKGPSDRFQRIDISLKRDETPITKEGHFYKPWSVTSAERIVFWPGSLQDSGPMFLTTWYKDAEIQDAAVSHDGRFVAVAEKPIINGRLKHGVSFYDGLHRTSLYGVQAIKIGFLMDDDKASHSLIIDPVLGVIAKHDDGGFVFLIYGSFEE